MKRPSIIAIALLALSLPVSAQLYVQAGLGYAMSLGGVQLDRDRIESTTGVESFTYKYGSYGQGFELAGAVGYTVTPSVALELGICYNLGPSYEAKEVRQNPAQNRERTHTASLFSLVPSIVVKGTAWGMNPYARFGVVVGFPSAKMEEVRPNEVITSTYSGNQFFGFHGACGVAFPMSKELVFFGEFTIQGGSWSPTKLEERVGATVTTITLKDEFTDAEQFVAEQPSLPFGSAGVRAGVRLAL
ncbi:MAG: outer membrane beta-barrel protein [Bacteroidetes bacterium]|nr:outer membrane beta-barrel protein [Bacteroidota bacterium]